MLQDRLLIKAADCTAEGTLAQHLSAITSIFPAKILHMVDMHLLLGATMIQQARQAVADRYVPTPSPVVLQL